MSWTDSPRLQPIRQRSRFADFVLDIVAAYSRHRTGRNASLIAYMGILTVFPLLLGATTVLGLVLEGNENLQNDILDSALSQIPVVGASLEQNQGEITGSWLVLVFGLAGALWGSMRAFLALQTALDDIWEVETGRANFLVQRVRAMIGIGVIGAAQVGSVVLAALVGQAGLPRTSQLLLTVGGLALNVAVVGAMYRYLTSRRMTWRGIAPGTVFTAVLFTALQFVGTNLMAAKIDDAQEVYGVFGGLIALASWISLHALVALLGAEINAALDRRRHLIGPLAGTVGPVGEEPPLPERLFVYGTLRPGDVRWKLLQPFVADEGTPDSVTGVVYDTGRGYPAAVFGEAGVIRGRTYRLVPERIEEALAVLDAEESSVPGDFTRVQITTAAGTTAWAYAYGSGLALTEIKSGDWLTRPV